MAISYTTKGQIPLPDGAEPNNVPLHLLNIANRIDAILGVEPFTTAQRDALAAAQKWDGRIIWNSTVVEHQGWNATSSAWQSIGGGGWSRQFLLMGA